MVVQRTITTDGNFMTANWEELVRNDEYMCLQLPRQCINNVLQEELYDVDLWK